ncbi:MAG TPA: glucose-6-phosphate dehydrogenase [Gemmatimonadota bacterium]|nr:glucose-6-phosphate dehydrogenase [Gemmatimonadota bacterium]
MSKRVIQARPTVRPGKYQMPKVRGCTFVIFGATGDLTERKLMPALYRLARKRCLGGEFRVLGVSRGQMSDGTFRTKMREAVSEHVRELDAGLWDRFAERLHYMAADLKDEGAYRELARRMEEMGVGEAAAGNHLFYLAVPPSLAPDIVRGLASANLTGEGKGYTRIIIEKPFGRDLESARRLNEEIARHFRESQVYRIDHYLGKETVQNILAFRFGNTMFEPIWNRNYVDHVQITAAETIGVGDRGGFYDNTGALRDMIANHLLQLLTLTAMEPPIAYDAHSVREEKVQVLRSIPVMSAAQVERRAVRGQYGPGAIDGKPVPGYREEEGMPPDSTTETYAAVELSVENWRWAGVPFYVRTGKRLGRDLTEIAVIFKPTPHTLFQTTDDRVPPNVIVIRLKPDEGIDATFSAKIPGQGMRTTRVRLEFDYEEAFGVELPDAYWTLLLDAMEGDATLFTRGDEAEAQWRLITPILEAWGDQEPPPFPDYAAGSQGPEAAARLTARNGHVWRDIVAATDHSVPDARPQAVP